MTYLEELDEFIKLYKFFYPNGGPSISSEAECRNDPPFCGCWRCQLNRMRDKYDRRNRA